MHEMELERAEDLYHLCPREQPGGLTSAAVKVLVGVG